MGAPTIIPHEDEFKVARIGLENQCQLHGIDMEAHKAFFDNLVNVMAHKDALSRQLQTTVNRQMGELANLRKGE